MHGRISLRHPFWSVIKSLGGPPAATHPPAEPTQRSLFLPSQPRWQQAPRVVSEDEFLAQFSARAAYQKRRKQPTRKAKNIAGLPNQKIEEKEDDSASHIEPAELATGVAESEPEPNDTSLDTAQQGSLSEDAQAPPGPKAEDTKLPNILQRLRPAVRKGLSNVTVEGIQDVRYENGQPRPGFFRLARKEISQRVHSETIRRERMIERHPRSPIVLQDIKQLLRRISPKGPELYEQHLRTARIPDGHTAHFDGEAHEAILMLSLHTSCRVQTKNDTAGHSGFTSLQLRGNRPQIDSALKWLRRLAHLVEDGKPDTRLAFQASLVSSYHDQDDLDFPAKVRTYWWSRASPQPLISTLNKRPSSWTTITFAEHICDLTALRPRRELRELAPDHNIPLKRIANELSWQLINAAKEGSYLSSEAVSKAFQWFCHYREYLPMLRDIVNQLERSTNYSMTASNYEIMLESMAMAEDLHNFHYVVRSMAERGVLPTWKSHAYAYYMACLRDPASAAELMQQMIAQGVMADVDAVRHTAASTAHLLARHFQDKTLTKPLDRILERFDTLFDPRRLGQSYRQKRIRDWLSPENANRLADFFLLQGRTYDALRMIEILLDSGDGQKADRKTPNVFIRSASALKEAPKALAILSLLKVGSPEAKARLDQHCWQLLWQLAWRLRLYNMLRVIWRYACLAGQVDFEFQRRVWVSLERYPINRTLMAMLRADESDIKPQDDERIFDAGTIWKIWMGKFVVGVADGLEQTDGIGPIEKEMVAVSSHVAKVDSEMIRRNRELFDRVHKADQEEAGSLVPVRPLFEALEEAYERDVAWGLPYPYRVIELSNLTWGDFKHLAPEERQRQMADALHKAFHGMMDDAVRIEVRVGDVSRPRKSAQG